MAIEIERKFLPCNEDWRDHVERSTEIRQGYLAQDGQRAIRVRIFGERAHLNIKANIDGIHRHEFEYPLPLADAQALFEHVVQGPVIHKIRHALHIDGQLWEIDEFLGDNAPLVVAEIELNDADQHFTRPAWLGEEVSRDPRYFNSQLAVRPYSRW
jgi:adenylate cyclase